MATIWHLTLNLRLGQNGKSESFYYDGTLTGAIAAGKLWASKRNLILVRSCVIQELVVRGITNPGVTDFDPLTDVDGGALGTSLLNDVRNVASMYRATTASGFQAKPWLHGAPDDWHLGSSSAQQYVHAQAKAMIQAYLDQLNPMGMMIRGASRKPEVATPVRITNFTVVDGVVKLFAPGFVPNADGMIRVSRCKGWKANQFNEDWRVISTPTAGEFVLDGPYRIDPNFFYVQKSGTVKRLVWEYEVISQAKFKKLGTRRMGRIPNVEAGRQ